MHLALHAVTRHPPILQVGFSHPLPILDDVRVLRELLPNNVGQQLIQEGIRLLQVVNAVLILDDILHVAFQTGPQDLSQPLALAADSSKAPKEQCHILYF